MSDENRILSFFKRGGKRDQVDQGDKNLKQFNAKLPVTQEAPAGGITEVIKQKISTEVQAAINKIWAHQAVEQYRIYCGNASPATFFDQIFTISNFPTEMIINQLSDDISRSLVGIEQFKTYLTMKKEEELRERKQYYQTFFSDFQAVFKSGKVPPIELRGFEVAYITALSLLNKEQLQNANKPWVKELMKIWAENGMKY